MRAAAALVALAVGGAASAADVAPIPRDAQQVLRTYYPSYRISPSRAFVPAGKAPLPSHVIGDFDGNGSPDVAVMLERKSSPDSRIVVVLFRHGARYAPQYAGTAADYIYAYEAGTEDFSYDTGRHFRYALDTVFSGIDEKAGYSLIYRNGRFFVEWTSD